MQELHDLQSAFAGALLDPDQRPPQSVCCHTPAGVARRFNVYRNNVAVSLIDALKSTFPVVSRLVGDEFFGAVAREFVRTAPPRSPILSRYGAAFPAFLRSFPPVADVPYLGDVALLEWLQLRAYHAPDAPSLGPSDFASLDPATISRIVVTVHPSMRLFTSQFASVSIWRTNTFNETVQPIDDIARGEDALVVRPSLQTIVLPLPSGTHRLVDRLSKGETLGAAFTSAAAEAPCFDIQFALAALIDCGVISAFHIERGMSLLRPAENRA